MAEAEFEEGFQIKFKKLRDPAMQSRIYKQIDKILTNPEIGKPMQNSRKNTREVYIGSFRLSYKYFHLTDTVVFTDIYHKDVQ